MSNEQNNGRRTNLQILDDRRDELANGLATYKQFLEVIPVNKQEQFKRNFLELCTQDYLLSIIDTKELIRFATNVTKTGLDIAPSSKEVYIIPFDTLVNKVKTMLPQAIIPLNGMQQLAYQKGFFLQLDAVWKFDDGTCEAESKLSRLQQSQLQTANAKWVDTHFIGFEVVLKDMKNEIPTQTKFVDLNYVKEATKTIKDERWKLQTWRHKAVRRAYGDFMIPRDRKIEAFEEIEHLNDSILGEAEVLPQKFLTKEIEDGVKQLGLSVSKNDGIAKVEGKTFGKDKVLVNMGFVYENGTYAMQYQEQESLPKPEQSKQKSPAYRLMQYLKDNGLHKDEIGSFVKDELGLSSEDVEGIETVLLDMGTLNEKIQSFLTTSDNEVPESMF
ncbi:hypothetical protein [Sulfurimonas sp.]|uniref:hypothetical protein n=1 Tax=Sulfurimonas sp. TaxID=2022749 RepID=UPI0025F74E68|nr:hypothetical protein [Sulfurimonas sp.]MBW6487479.1 hypothetical protein [Sulfurimonas sp.]